MDRAPDRRCAYRTFPLCHEAHNDTPLRQRQHLITHSCKAIISASEISEITGSVRKCLRLCDRAVWSCSRSAKKAPKAFFADIVLSEAKANKKTGQCPVLVVIMSCYALTLLSITVNLLFLLAAVFLCMIFFATALSIFLTASL